MGKTANFAVLLAATGGLVACPQEPAEAPTPKSTQSAKVSASAEASNAQLRAKLDEVIEPIIKDGWVKGLVIGVVEKGKRSLFGYGRTSDTGEPPTADTVFEIGSVTKIFTALLLSDAVERKIVALDDKASAHLPGVSLPSKSDKEITLKHLATHSSGLPNVPPSFSLKDLSNPWAKQDEAKLLGDVVGLELQSEPGAKFSYSNLGYGLLGVLLSRRDKTPYEQLLLSRIIEPLGMNSTRITLTDEMRGRMAQGHNAEGEAVSNWDYRAYAGAGALRSTAKDMLAFVQANLDPPSDLAGAIRRTHDKHGVGLGAGIGLAWQISPSGSLWHDGQTGGFHTFVALNRKRQHGLVVLSNCETYAINEVGSAVARILVGKPAKLNLPPMVQVPAETLERYVGRYELAPGIVMEILRDGDKLYVKPPGQERVRLYPFSQTEFVLRMTAAAAKFVLPEKGPATEMIWQQGGQKGPAKRVQ